MNIITVLTNALIFDLDGTLIDSSALYERVWTRWSQRVGVSAEKILLMSHGRRHQDVIASMLPDNWTMDNALKAYYEEEANEGNAPEIAGAKALLSQLPPDRWAIVTSSGKTLTKRRLINCDFPMPHLLITSDDVNVGKPDPTGYNLAISKLNLQPSDCLVFEDAHNGIQAAKAANANVIVVAGTFDKTDFPGENTISDLTKVKYAGMSSDKKIKLEIEIQ